MTNEEIAELIYNTWQDRPGFVPWVPNGNSIRQDEARRVADKALAARDARIEQLEAEVKTALRREAETTARYDAKIDALEAKIARKDEALRWYRDKAQKLSFVRHPFNQRKTAGELAQDSGKRALAALEATNEPA